MKTLPIICAFLLSSGIAFAQTPAATQMETTPTKQMSAKQKKKAAKRKKMKANRMKANQMEKGPSTPTDGVAGKPSSPVPGPGSNAKSTGPATTPTTPTDGVAGTGKSTSTPKASSTKSKGPATSGERTDGVAAPSPSPSPGSR